MFTSTGRSMISFLWISFCLCLHTCCSSMFLSLCLNLLELCLTCYVFSYCANNGIKWIETNGIHNFWKPSFNLTGGQCFILWTYVVNDHTVWLSLTASLNLYVWAHCDTLPLQLERITTAHPERQRIPLTVCQKKTATKHMFPGIIKIVLSYENIWNSFSFYTIYQKKSSAGSHTTLNTLWLLWFFLFSLLEK